MPDTPTRILYCRCAYAKVVPDDVKDGVLKGLSESDVPFESVTDLCEMSARRDPCLRDLADAANDGPIRIAACHPRAVKWLFHAAGCPLPKSDGHIEILNMREQTAGEIAAHLLD